MDEAISFIKQLEGTVQNLERLKQERARARQGAAADLGAGSSSASPPPPPPVAPWETPSHILPIPKIWSWLPKKKRQQEQPGAIVAAPPMLTWSEPNVRVCVIGDEAHINVRAPRLRGVLPLVLSVLEKHHIDVLTAQIYACNAYQSIFTFFTRVSSYPAPCISSSMVCGLVLSVRRLVAADICSRGTESSRVEFLSVGDVI